MTVVFHPKPGTIVRVDLNEGFRPPEMGKRRPAIVLSPELLNRPDLCTIVPLSTTPPGKQRGLHHMLIGLDPPLPDPFSSPQMWLKGDIVLTVALRRLRHIFARFENGKRMYDIRVLDDVTFAAVQRCVRFGLGL